MSDQWRDSLAGARMQVDQQFSDRIVASEFSNQQWGLIMTAVEFDIESPEEPESARLVADTEQVEQIIPELDNIPQGMGAGTYDQRGDSGGGILGRIKTALTGDDGSDDETLAEATQLADQYAEELQSFLEEQGRWESLCERAADQ